MSYLSVFFHSYLFLNKSNKICLAYITYILTSVLFFMNHPMLNNKVTVFKRVIGNGIVNNYDVSSVISHFYVMFLVVIIVTCIVICVYNFAQRHFIITEQQKLAWDFMNDVVFVGAIANLLKSQNYFTVTFEQLFSVSSMLIAVLSILTALYIVYHNRFTEWHTYYLAILGISGIVFPVISLLSSSFDLLKFCIVLFLLMGMFLLCSNLRVNLGNHINYNLFLASLSLFPLITSVMIESFNVLASRGYIIVSPRRTYFALTILFIIIAVIISVISKQKILKPNNLVNRLAIPAFLMGLTMLSVQLPLLISPGFDIFESANYSVLISDFLSFNKIPIVEHYGGHMLSGVSEGILYGILNNDFVGASFSPYFCYENVIKIMLFFFVIRLAIGTNMAFLTALVVPFDNIFNYTIIGLAGFMAVWQYLKKQSYKSALLLWLILSLCCLYRLDLGYSVLLASVGTTLYFCGFYDVTNKNKKRLLKKFIVAMFVIIMAFAGLWFLICILKGINPISRLLEFIYISASNQNWAYTGIGNPSKAIYFIVYLVFPVFVITSLFYVMLRYKNEITFINTDHNYIILLLVFLGLSYVVNFQRGLVRHSLLEFAIPIIVWNATLYLSLLSVLILKKRKFFLPVFCVLMVFFGTIETGNCYSRYSVADLTHIKMQQISQCWKDNKYATITNKGKTSVTRIQWSEGLKQYAFPLNKVLNILLANQETYLDFMNRSFLYSVLQRKSPVYVSQSPLQLSGEYTQERFVDEINNQLKTVPLAILPIGEKRASSGLDGIKNNYRYYKVAEFIYTNYQPLCQIDEYAIWVTKERYADMKTKLDKYFSTGQEAVKNVVLSKLSKAAVHSCQLRYDTDSHDLKIKTSGGDPFIYDIQDMLFCREFVGKEIVVKVICNSDVSGPMQLFYTTEAKENYNAKKVVTVNVGKDTIAKFKVPVTKYTKMRLDFPEKSNVTIKAIEIEDSMRIKSLDYGYDGPENKKGNVSYSSLHNHNLVDLPLLWAEKDVKKAINNKIVAELKNEGMLYIIPPGANKKAEAGHYLAVSCTNESDNIYNAYVALGTNNNGIFEEKCRFYFNMHPGKHNYLFRISSEYYWHIGLLNAAILNSNSRLKDIDMRILEGD